MLHSKIEKASSSQNHTSTAPPPPGRLPVRNSSVKTRIQELEGRIPDQQPGKTQKKKNKKPRTVEALNLSQLRRSSGSEACYSVVQPTILRLVHPPHTVAYTHSDSPPCNSAEGAHGLKSRIESRHTEFRKEESDISPVALPFSLTEESSFDRTDTLAQWQCFNTSSQQKLSTDPVTAYAFDSIERLRQSLKTNDPEQEVTCEMISHWIAEQAFGMLSNLPNKPAKKTKPTIEKSLASIGLLSDVTEQFFKKLFTRFRTRAQLAQRAWTCVSKPAVGIYIEIYNKKLEIKQHIDQFIEKLTLCESLDAILKNATASKKNIEHLETVAEVILASSSTLNLLKKLNNTKSRSKLFIGMLPDLKYHILNLLNTTPTAWPSANEKEAAALFSSFEHYDDNAFLQDVRGWTTEESPIFANLTLSSEGQMSTLCPLPFTDSSASYTCRKEYLFTLVHQARALGYAQNLKMSEDAIVTGLLSNIYVPYFSRLFRAGSNGIFAQAVMVLRQYFQVGSSPFSIDYKNTDADGKSVGGGIELSVRFHNDTDFSTRYRRAFTLLSDSASFSSDNPIIARIHCDWQLDWKGTSGVPKGSLSIQLVPDKNATQNEIWRILHIWSQGYASRQQITE